MQYASASWYNLFRYLQLKLLLNLLNPLSFQDVYVLQLYTLWRHERVVEISAVSEIHQELSETLDLLQVQMENLVALIISLDGPTVIFNFQIEEGWTQEDPSHSWRGSTIRATRGLSLTICQMAGEYTSGWLHLKCCLHGLRVEGDAVLQRRWPADEYDLDNGSLLVQFTISEQDAPSCLSITGSLPISILVE